MNWENKVALLKEAGVGRLHVICDFDRTLTHHLEGGSSFSPVRRLGFMPEEYGEKALALYEHYHPMEVDPLIPFEEKSALMHEWWEAQFHLMIQYGLRREHLDQMIGKGYVRLREGVGAFMHALAAQDVPMLVLSAGFGDVVEIVLQEAGLLTEHVHIVSNFVDYDEGGRAVAYRPPIIHTLNKSEQDLGPYRAMVAERPNVLLVGDMLGDAHMAEGLPHDTVLKVGFLNHPTETNRLHYEATFDVVIEGDHTWSRVTALWDQILSGGTL